MTAFILLVICTAAAVGIVAHSGSTTEQTPQKALLNKKLSVSVKNVTMYELVKTLRQNGVPISFIDAFDNYRSTLEVKDASLAEVLARIVSANPIYRYRFIGKRLVLYAKDPTYTVLVKKPDIKDMARLWAAEKYVEKLRREIRDFSDLNPPYFFGNFRSPVYQDKVTLRDEASVIEHLVELLGDNPGMVFSITMSYFGREPHRRYFKILLFDAV